MTPNVFASSAIVLAGLIGFCMIFQAPLFGLALFYLAGTAAYVIVKMKDE